jgi:hypothetical protein
MSALAQKSGHLLFYARPGPRCGRIAVDLPLPLHQVVIHLKTEEECFGAYE